MTDHSVILNSSNTNGYLELILGPMFSGKTTSLLEIYKQCNYCKIPVSIINHSLDTRYDESMLSTHDKIMIPCIQCNHLKDIWNITPLKNSIHTADEFSSKLSVTNLYTSPPVGADSNLHCYKSADSSFDNTGCNHIKLRDSHVILINEGQFFDDLYEIVVDMLNEKKQIYICGLDGDFNRNKFGQLLDLIPLCDKVTKLTSLCSKCRDGTRGIFSLRLSCEKEQTIVGSDNYIPVCRRCYNHV